MELLAQQKYLRQRMQPAHGDTFYLHLADLRGALAAIASKDPIRVLDFGCGGSPYRQLFPAAEYRRADLAGQDAIDYVIAADSHIDAPDGYFDLILSSQVLEHVTSPAAYLAECSRLLKPGGMLACSTHGTFEDHACPDDYWRWTADGLFKAMTASGFTVEKHYKLTAGPRALFFLMERMLVSAKAPWWSLLGLCLRPLRWLFKHQRRYLHKMNDQLFSQYSRLERADDDGRQVYYIALLSLARKPG